jgi:hypothetical protein
MLTQTTTQPSTRSTSYDLTSKITQHIEELAKATDAARLSEEMLRYMETQRPDATFVAGFHKWLTMHRWVKKGERGIPILAPIIFKEENGDPQSRDVVIGFKPVFVFDVCQTQGEPLPEPPNWKSPQKNAELALRLIEYAHSQGINVLEQDLSNDIQGISKGGVIELDPSSGTKTLIHEIAHELMHRDKDRPLEKGVRELEAESVAYVVGRHFGLEELSSPNYVAMHGATSIKIMQHLERIRRTATEIILAMGGGLAELIVN